MCVSCIRSQVDISEGISKSETILFCRECERYLQPPKFWLAAKLESRELMSLCLKRIKGLNRVKLIDASWIWTEPHSRRLKIKVTVQDEVFNGTILQQSFIVDFVVKNQQCETCQASYTTKTWTALVQVRQKVNHKRTFFHLEQLILKHNAHENTINIKERPDGIDFYFGHRSHAQKFNEFVSSLAPCKTELGKRLQTHDDKSNIYTYKYTFSTEIAPICREDIVCLPKKLYSSMGGLGPVVICTKVNTSLHFLCPQTLRMGEVPGNLYWKNPFDSLMDSRHQTEYIVLDIEVLNVTAGKRDKYVLAEAEIVRSDELGNDDKIMFVKTHLGNVLNPGDTVMGYDITNANVNDSTLRKYKDSQIPEVVLCHKVYPRKNRRRKWHLKKMKTTQDEEDTKGKARSENTKRERTNAEYERFLQQLEEDEELRKTVNIYRKKSTEDADVGDTNQNKAGDDGDDDDDGGGDDDDIPEIADEELQDEEEEEEENDDSDLAELEESMQDLEIKLGGVSEHDDDDDDDELHDTNE